MVPVDSRNPEPESIGGTLQMSWNCENKGLQRLESNSGEAAGPHPAPAQTVAALEGEVGSGPVWQKACAL